MRFGSPARESRTSVRGPMAFMVRPRIYHLPNNYFGRFFVTIECMNIWVLATDLDDTLVGEKKGLIDLFTKLHGLRQRGEIKLVYVTGRSTTRYKELQNDWDLETPDALVTSVGTEIFINESPDASWPEISWWDCTVLKDILADFPELTMQPESEQRAYKLCYFLIDRDDIALKIQYKLKDYPVDVIYSDSHYLDILPKDVNKGSAIKHVAKQWGVDPSNIVCCGDSGNDIGMLEVNKAIVVSNAKRELLAWAKNTKNTNVYMAKKGYASGIIEGLGHFGILDHSNV